MFFLFFTALAGKALLSTLFAKNTHTLQNRRTNRTEPWEPAWMLTFSVLFSDTTQYNVLEKVEQNPNPVISENGRRCKAIPRMRGTLIKALVHALRALSRASKNNWSQKAQAKKSPTWRTMWGVGHNIICCMSSRMISQQGRTWHCSLWCLPWPVSPLQTFPVLQMP
jgi:hypothetical protein